MKRALAFLAFGLVASVTIADTHSSSPAADPSLAAMADDIESSYWNQQGKLMPPAPADSGAKSGSTSSGNPLSDSTSIGGAINSAFSNARNISDWWDDSNLLDQATDSHYQPDLSGEGSPDIPASLCGASDECNQCYARVFSGLDNMRMNLEKLRVAGRATSDLVSKSYALGDGLSGVTGVAALQWQYERAGIAKNFEHFKGTYDSKYEGMMKGLKDVMDRWDACEGQYGERDWYARFGFLYYQFMRDKYKRNF
jgi:hypothetical protein